MHPKIVMHIHEARLHNIWEGEGQTQWWVQSKSGV